ncbi:hypothetical protein DFH09DRAFT_1098106 [Mycena vulgaris]|nr:hypothetical protein DFH09DRAFT_1098106 [Mycena vulgaris]
MDGNLSQQAVKLARKYTKQLPAPEIPSLESIRARGSGSSSNSPIVPFPSSASTQVLLRAQKRSQWRKMNDVLRTYGFDSLGDFLSALFHPRIRGEKDYRTRRHRQALGAFLRGRCTTTMADIIPFIFNHSSSRPKQTSALRHFPHTNRSKKSVMPTRAWLAGQRGSSAIAYTNESASSQAKIAQIPEAAVICKQQAMAVRKIPTLWNERTSSS